MSSKIIRFSNVRIIRDGKIIKENFWIKNGKILNPEPLFFLEKESFDLDFDCQNLLISPGYIELQINGKIEFLDHVLMVEKCLFLYRHRRIWNRFLKL